MDKARGGGMSSTHGDKTQAEALRIAYEIRVKLGWKFTPSDIGKTAREILQSLATGGRDG